ncbi:ZU5 domain-containing protein [Desulfonema limicola]|uniref:ZU5 domain-containing protein n=1 Tax=Desulfonema limicola TaxID=45656 RepID=A0A975B4T6_9BACT|nr:hypothetical protein [Desulfonema limicola]QTA78787.1 ZU5 domain-containing protein [Desulfonema limicola]
MKKIVLITSILMCCIFAGTSWAVELSLFEKDYLRNNGKTDFYSDTFIAQEHEARLIIINGNENGDDRVSSASLFLNGQEIVSSRDFNQKVFQQEFTVDLLEENTISVELSSKPGSYLKIQIIQEIDAVAAAVIGSEGGVLKIEDSESPIYGARIEVPSAAVDHDIILTMNHAELTTDLPDGLNLASPVVDFGPSGTLFNESVLITIPYYDDDNDGYLDSLGLPEENVQALSYSDKWEYLETVSLDTLANKIIVKANHFTNFCVASNNRPPQASMTIDYTTYVLGNGEHIRYQVRGEDDCGLTEMRLEVFKLDNGVRAETIVQTVFPNVEGKKVAEFQGTYAVDGSYYVGRNFEPGVYDCLITVIDVLGEITKYHKQIAIGRDSVEKNGNYITFDVARMIDNGGRILNENIDFYNFDPPEVGDSDCMNFASRSIICGLGFTDYSGRTPLLNRFYQMDWLDTTCENNWYNFATSTEYRSDICGSGNTCKDISESFRVEFVERIAEGWNFGHDNTYFSKSWKSVASFEEYIKRSNRNEGLSGDVIIDNNIQLGDLLYNGSHIVVVVGIEGMLNQDDIWDDNTKIRIYQHGNYKVDENGELKPNYHPVHTLRVMKGDYGDPLNVIRISGYYLPDRSTVDSVISQIEHTERFDIEAPQGQVTGIEPLYKEGKPIQFTIVGTDNMQLAKMRFQIVAINGGIVYDSDPQWEVSGKYAERFGTISEMSAGSYEYVLWVKDRADLATDIRGNFRILSADDNPPTSEKVLTEVIVKAGSDLYENSNAYYTATAVFSDNSIDDVTNKCEWLAYPTKYVESIGNGDVRALPGSAGNEVTIQAKYTYNNIAIIGKLKAYVK